jgi:hypothetical protein
MPIYLVPVIGCSFLEKVEFDTQNRTPEGAPPYIASGGLNGSLQH